MTDKDETSINENPAPPASQFERLVMTGRSVRFYFGEGNVNNEVVHIRAIVDDLQVVIRSWSKRKKMWKYRVESVRYFSSCYDNGNLIKA